MNRFADAAGTEPPLHRSDPALERKQVERVKAHRARRPRGRGRERARDAPHRRRDRREPDAGDHRGRPRGVTVGEMCDALREVWGTWRETPSF